MEITLNHTIVNSHDKIKSAKFYERVFGFDFLKVWGHFAVVKVNSTLTLDFMDREKFSRQHYAFKVSEEDFDRIFENIKKENIPYGSNPAATDNMKINHHYGGRGVYFPDPNGHSLEILTADYDIYS